MKRSRIIFKGVRLCGRWDDHFRWSRRWTRKVPSSRAFINIYFCNHPHRSTSASAVSTRNDLNRESFLRWDRRGATKECLMDTLHFLRPKLERFSEKQLNQDYLQMRLGPYFSLYRGDSLLLNGWSEPALLKPEWLISCPPSNLHHV